MCCILFSATQIGDTSTITWKEQYAHSYPIGFRLVPRRPDPETRVDPAVRIVIKNVNRDDGNIFVWVFPIVYILYTIRILQLPHSMALPVIRSIADCTDFSKTVLPYIGQLYDLPQQVFDNITNVQALKVLYVSTNPLISAFAFSLFIFPIFLLVSEINRNYSQVDRCWSILPTIYNAHFTAYAHATGLSTRRLDMLLLFSSVWSVSSRVSRRHRLLLTALGAAVIQLLAERRI